MESTQNILRTFANRYASRASKPVYAERVSASLSSNCSSLPSFENLKNSFNKLLNKLKFYCSKLKPKQKLPRNYTPERLEEFVDATLKKYLECYKPNKGQSLEKFKESIRSKLSKFYINEAKKAEEILIKNKSVIEELDKNYKLQFSKIMQHIKTNKMSKEERYKYVLAEKVKIDQLFGEKILDIFAKEYNMEGIKPTLKCCEKIKGKTVGAWDSISGKIEIDSSAFVDITGLVGTLFHEFTHFRQDVEIFKRFGEKAFLEYSVSKVGLELKKRTPQYTKLLSRCVCEKILSNPMYQKLKIYAKEHACKTKYFKRNLVQIRVIENVHYKDSTRYSYDEYANQIGELHAHHNGNYIRDLYKKMFPDYATLKRTKE